MGHQRRWRSGRPAEKGTGTKGYSPSALALVETKLHFPNTAHPTFALGKVFNVCVRALPGIEDQLRLRLVITPPTEGRVPLNSTTVGKFNLQKIIDVFLVMIKTLLGPTEPWRDETLLTEHFAYLERRTQTGNLEGIEALRYTRHLLNCRELVGEKKARRAAQNA